MKRIHILGASGSGVSTLGEGLGKSLSLPVFDCDFYYWEKTEPPFLKATPIPERQKALLKDMERHHSWVCSGSMDSWSEPFEKLFTHIIFLYVPREVRARRLRAREKERHGDRIFTSGDMHIEHEKFISWAEQYDEGTRSGRSLPRHQVWLARQTVPILKIEGVQTTKQSLEQALKFLQD